MSKIMYMDEEYCGNYPSTSTPIAGIDAAFDSDAHINSEDMSSQDVEDFLADINAQGTPSEYRKLLWTNPSPTSAFAAQTVISGADLTEYDAFDIVMHANMSNAQSGYSNIVTKGTSGTMVTGSAPSANDSWYGVRKITITDTSITFGNGGYYYLTGGGNDLNNNNYGIPYQIYGIKYERVAPPQVEYPNYSTEEQQVGTWVTGKPLYRKVFQYANMPNNTTAVYAHNISNMDIVVRYTCCWWDSNDGRFLMSPRDDSSTIKIRCSINKTNIVFEAIGTNWSTRTNNVNVIVEYTKTTD